MSFDNEAASIDVGLRLRELREARRISMRELARRSGLSANALSMIERNLTSPSVSTLTKLAGALEIPITTFFRKEPEKSQIVVKKASERNRVPFMRGLWEGLGGESFVGKVEAFLLTLENGGSSGPHCMLHSGHEFVFCLRGTLEYDGEGEAYTLEAGDSLMFASKLMHRWRNPGKTVTNAIIVITGFEESDHPSEYHLASAKIKSIKDIEAIDEEIETEA